MTPADPFSPPLPRGGAASWLVLVGLIVLCQATGVLGGLITSSSLEPWYASLAKPPFNPPSWVFGPVWTLLYLLMAIAAWLVWRAPVGTSRRTPALFLFGIHLVANFAWSAAFFGLESPLAGLLVIVLLFGLILATAWRFARIVPLAGLLFIPYIGWTGFAAILNFAIWRLNG